MKFMPLMIALATVMTAAPAAAQPVENPTPGAERRARARGPCRDPWVTIAVEAVHGRVPDVLHCDINLYANGRWNSYAQLLGEVRNKRYSFAPVAIMGNGPLAGKSAIGIFSNGNLEAAGGSGMLAAAKAAGNMVAAGAGNMVAAGAGNMVAAGAGNMVAAGAGNMVAAGAGNMVAAGAGNMVAAGAGNLMQNGNSLISPGAGYRLQSGRPVRVIN